jgi:hypothetical protein
VAQREWTEPGLGGRVTAIFPARRDWHRQDVDAFKDPSIHWNHHLGRFVMLLNRAIERNWKQEGIYVSFVRDLANPAGWTKPHKILGDLRFDQWYTSIIGLDRAGVRRTSWLAGRHGCSCVGNRNGRSRSWAGENPGQPEHARSTGRHANGAAPRLWPTGSGGRGCGFFSSGQSLDHPRMKPRSDPMFRRVPLFRRDDASIQRGGPAPLAGGHFEPRQGGNLRTLARRKANAISDVLRTRPVADSGMRGFEIPFFASKPSPGRTDFKNPAVGRAVPFLRFRVFFSLSRFQKPFSIAWRAHSAPEIAWSKG